jgi:hypothetical protein
MDVRFCEECGEELNDDELTVCYGCYCEDDDDEPCGQCECCGCDLYFDTDICSACEIDQCE